ncbi:hypothetical protein [Thalassoglobus polymorphus]|uniref:Phage protein n=1 Tax=Thalassoglobus polymorphus TaxID=2527994 RepID=A0A517QGT4_9PLAN|nr:hypothetical protein [Thalassoglobus polymorphus]QDT30849.1 hypothetical protein Mal48_00770 [Thalassoglobus polymorphus]
MRQMKLFKGVEMEISALETEVNEWIQENGIAVISISGNITPQSHSSRGQERMSGSDILIIVEYEK